MKSSETNGEDNDETNGEDGDETSCEDGDETEAENDSDDHIDDEEENGENDEEDEDCSLTGTTNGDPATSQDEETRYIGLLPFRYIRAVELYKQLVNFRETNDIASGGTKESTPTETRSDSQFEEFMHKKLTPGLVSERIKSLLAKNLATSDSSKMAESSRNQRVNHSTKRADVHLSTVDAVHEMYE